MAVKLRLMRTGKTKQPSYRVVAKEARTPRGGQYIELLGTYNPLATPAEVKLNEDRIKHWLSVGAQPTETVERLIRSNTDIALPEKAGAAATARKSGAVSAKAKVAAPTAKVEAAAPAATKESPAAPAATESAAADAGEAVGATESETANTGEGAGATEEQE
jgi:small subunit ribosomal protein S16